MKKIKGIKILASTVRGGMGEVSIVHYFYFQSKQRILHTQVVVRSISKGALITLKLDLI